ncbi:hypothetical protein BGW80DRAFT_1498400, partial [Lactifluus volemus]
LHRVLTDPGTVLFVVVCRATSIDFVLRADSDAYISSLFLSFSMCSPILSSAAREACILSTSFPVLFSRCIPGPTCFLSPPALPACLSYLPPPPQHHSLPPPLSPASFPALPCCCRHEEITRASDLLLTLASPFPSLPLDVSGSPNAKTLLRLWSRSTNRN